MTPQFDHFLPYQRAWIVEGAPVAIGEKARRVGWTYASAYRAVQRRLERETDLFYTSSDLTGAREFVEQCQRWARAFNEPARDMGTQVIDEREGLTAFVLRFHNGARIVAGSSNPKFFRSKGGDADADEFAFHADQRGLLKAMHATAMVWGHRLRVWSTHNGEGSVFNEFIRSARAGERTSMPRTPASELKAKTGIPAPPDVRDPGLRSVQTRASGESSHARTPTRRVHRVTILDAVAQGLVERIKGLDAPDEHARREWLEELRASCPDEDTWREEYLCQPGSGEGALLGYDVIRACEVAEEAVRGRGGEWVAHDGPLLPFTPSPTRPLSPAVLYAGFDVGRKRDRSVLWVLEPVGDVFHTRAVRVLERRPFSEQEDLLNLLLRDPRVKRLCVDATGIGAMLAERLKQRWHWRVEGVHFTSATKGELAMPLVRLFQERLVRIPADAETREDLHKVRRTVTGSGNVRLDASHGEDGHADRFWALALAHHAAAHAPRRPLPTLLRKPADW